MLISLETLDVHLAKEAGDLGSPFARLALLGLLFGSVIRISHKRGSDLREMLQESLTESDRSAFLKS